MSWLRIMAVLVRAMFRNRRELAAENLALRQQLAVLHRQSKRPRLRTGDRILWVWLSRIWAGWRSCLVIVQPETVVRWQWQSPYVERIIGSIRRECLNHVIILNEGQLRRILRSYFEYYHHSRTHLSLHRNSPVPREIEPPERGEVIVIPQVGAFIIGIAARPEPACACADRAHFKPKCAPATGSSLIQRLRRPNPSIPRCIRGSDRARPSTEARRICLGSGSRDGQGTLSSAFSVIFVKSG